MSKNRPFDLQLRSVPVLQPGKAHLNSAASAERLLDSGHFAARQKIAIYWPIKTLFNKLYSISKNWFHMNLRGLNRK